MPTLRFPRGSFEVFVDDRPLFSRLLTGKFPVMQSLVEVRRKLRRVHCFCGPVEQPCRSTTGRGNDCLLDRVWRSTSSWASCQHTLRPRAQPPAALLDTLSLRPSLSRATCVQCAHCTRRTRCRHLQAKLLFYLSYLQCRGVLTTTTKLTFESTRYGVTGTVTSAAHCSQRAAEPQPPAVPARCHPVAHAGTH